VHCPSKRFSPERGRKRSSLGKERPGVVKLLSRAWAVLTDHTVHMASRRRRPPGLWVWACLFRCVPESWAWGLPSAGVAFMGPSGGVGGQPRGLSSLCIQRRHGNRPGAAPCRWTMMPEGPGGTPFCSVLPKMHACAPEPCAVGCQNANGRQTSSTTTAQVGASRRYAVLHAGHTPVSPRGTFLRSFCAFLVLCGERFSLANSRVRMPLPLA